MNGERKWNEFYENNKLAADALLAHDRRGITSYHACASFGTPGSRAAANAVWMGTLWLDIDAGPGKPYAGADEAEEAVLDFCTLVELPDPLLVRSGRGVHAYWLLDAPISAAEWKPYAEGLKRTCVEHGLRADHVCTANAAAVLRPIGTHNRKNGNVLPVVCDHNFDRHNVRRFSCCLRSVASVASSGLSLGARPRYLQSSPSLVAQALKPEPSDVPTIAKHCAQVSRMRETHGLLAEPLWRACLGVLAFATDGDRYGHEWSKGDERYDAGETQSKLDRVRELGAPITCRALESQEPSVCETCKFKGKISTPLQLGRAPYLEPTVEIVDDIEKTIPGGYRYDGGILMEDDKHIAPFGLALAAISAHEKGDAPHRLTFQVEHPQDGHRRITLPAGEVFNRSPSAAMAEQNIVIYNDAAFKKYVTAAMTALQQTKKTDVLFKSYGWKEGRCFLVGDQLYTPVGRKVAPIDGEAKQRYKEFRPKGTVLAWADAASKLFAPGCETQGFTLMCSFAAPLMRMTSASEGGTVVSLVSRKTAQGKSVALAGVHSVWGEKVGLELNMTASENARGITYGALGNLPVIFDEAHMKDVDELNRLLRIFTNGRDRIRAAPDGTLRPNNDTWQTIMVCCANESMVDMIANNRGSDAMSYRVLELQASIPKGLAASEGDSLKRALENNCGHAGPMFLRLLVEQPGFFEIVEKAVLQEVDALRAQFAKEHRFWIRLLACVKVASRIVVKMGLLRFNPDRLMEWAYARAKEAIGDMRADSTGIGALSAYMNKYANQIISVATAHRHGLKTPPMFRPHGEIMGRYEADRGRLYLAMQPWRKWLAEQQYSAREVHKELEVAGIKALGARKVTLVAGVSDMSSGQTECIRIDAHHRDWRWEPKVPVVEDTDKVVNLRRRDESAAPNSFDRRTRE